MPDMRGPQQPHHPHGGSDDAGRRFVPPAERDVPLSLAGRVDEVETARSVAGTPLESVMSAGATMPTGQIVRILRDVASELDALHAVGVVHDAVSPSAITLDEAGGAHLVPYDAAPPSGPAYMAPEQRGGLMSPASDQYALAVIAWELLTGRRRANVLEGSHVAVLEELELGPTRVLRPGAGPDVNASLDRATTATAALRYESASAFVSALAAGLEHTGAHRTFIAPAPLMDAPSHHGGGRRFKPAPEARLGWLASRFTWTALSIGAVTAMATWGGPLVASLFGEGSQADDLPSRRLPWTRWLADSTPPQSAARSRSGAAAAAGAGAAGEPASTTGYITVSAGGGSASVFLDGNAVGNAPVVIQTSPGQHTVEARADGVRFAPGSVSVVVSAGDTASASFRPAP
jgi:hypothetical protein